MGLDIGDRQRVQRVDHALRAARTAHADLLEAIHDLDAAGIAGTAGYATPVQLLQDLGRLDPADARRLLAQSTTLVARTSLTGDTLDPTHPATARALTDGEIGTAHLPVIASAMRKIAALEHLIPDVIAQAEHFLAAQARLLPPRALARVGRVLLNRLDPDGAAPTERDTPVMAMRIRRRRDGGIGFEGAFGERADAEVFAALIDALSTRTSPDDDRSLEERQAAVLLEVCAQALAPGGLADDELTDHDHDTNPDDDPGDADLSDADPYDDDADTSDDDASDDDRGADQMKTDAADTDTDRVDETDPDVEEPDETEPGVPEWLARRTPTPLRALHPARPLITVTMDLRWLTDHVGHGLLDSDWPLSPTEVRRLACDATVIPVVLGTRNEPLDLGRASRTPTANLLRALHLRDRGCAYPGCTRRPRRCHAHHVRHWADGGDTCLENLCLLCPHHHTLVHRSDWHITMRDGRPWFTPPDWLDPTRTPRPGGPPHAVPAG